MMNEMRGIINQTNGSNLPPTTGLNSVLNRAWTTKVQRQRRLPRGPWSLGMKVMAATWELEPEKLLKRFLMELQLMTFIDAQIGNRRGYVPGRILSDAWRLFFFRWKPVLTKPVIPINSFSTHEKVSTRCCRVGCYKTDELKIGHKKLSSKFLMWSFK